ncbi:MAG: polysaccharide deacetylase family protein [Bacilli bacterium]|nr:polysaccharide deacetylase family protein [Bacilli bacterium]
MKKFLVLLIVLLLVGCDKIEEQPKEKNKKDIEQKEEIKEEVKELTVEDYQNNNVDELGEVPIMMYHGIHNKSNSDTEYTGGNVDKDGYQRTAEAFRNDLEFYYNEGYRMIRLTDYVDGNIDVELGKSPIILTFDDGLSNNIKVTGLDDNGDIIIDPNSAVGILESFKEKYPDFNVTATFFVNGGLFEQEEYNEKILNWLVDNGYDIGNHTYTHVNFSNVDSSRTQEEVGKIYKLLDEIIPEKYVNIVALPFGSPYNLEHDNMQYIFNTNYNGKKYETKSTLRVGWKAESSPFSTDFNPKFLKRIRAYDNNGVEFDIEMNFKLLENNRYISDGNIDTIVIPSSKESLVNNNDSKEIITY